MLSKSIFSPTWKLSKGRTTGLVIGGSWKETKSRPNGVAQIVSLLSPRPIRDSSHTGVAWVYRTRPSCLRYLCNLYDKVHKLHSHERPSANNLSAFRDRKQTASISLNCDRHRNLAPCPSARTGLREYPRGTLDSPSARSRMTPRLFFRLEWPACGTPRMQPSYEPQPMGTKSLSDRSSANPSMTLRNGRPRNQRHCHRAASAPYVPGTHRGEDPGGTRCRSGLQIGKVLPLLRTRLYPPYGTPSR